MDHMNIAGPFVDPDSAPRPCAGVVAKSIGSATFLVPVEENVADLDRAFVLSGTAEFVWGRLDGVRTREEIVRQLVGEFAVDEATARSDLEGFLSELVASGLVEAVAPREGR